MYCVEKILFFILINYVTSSEIDLSYNESMLLTKSPNYGKKWMYFPDSNGNAHVAIMEYPKTNRNINVNALKPIIFTLYTRANNGEMLNMTSKDLLESNYSIEKETKFITHGWMSSGNELICIKIRNAYLRNDDCNVIVVDWSSIAINVVYPVPAISTQHVGTYVAEFIEFLMSHGANSTKMHLIGHSLGAHVFGVAGLKLQKTPLGRITGLDPAKPLFSDNLLDGICNRSANFVDVIHTCAGGIGLNNPIGHVDFYPNGGDAPQPGCSGVIEIIQACSHASSWRYFMKSIEEPKRYKSYKSRSYNAYKRSMRRSMRRRKIKTYKRRSMRKRNIETAYMGNSVSKNARGTYFLIT